MLALETLATLMAHHVAHLVSNVLKPRLHRFDLRNHLCELVTNDGLGQKWFTKHNSLSCPSTRRQYDDLFRDTQLTSCTPRQSLGNFAHWHNT